MKRTMIGIDTATHAQLVAQAAREDRGVAKVATRILKQYLDKQARKRGRAGK